MITISGTLGLSLVLTLLFILSSSVFLISTYISILILKAINYRTKITKKQLYLFSGFSSLSLLILHFLSPEILEKLNLNIKFHALMAVLIYLFNMSVIFLFITAFFRLKKTSINHFNLLYFSTSIVSLLIWIILFYFLKGYIAFGAPLVFILAISSLALHKPD